MIQKLSALVVISGFLGFSGLVFGQVEASDSQKSVVPESGKVVEAGRHPVRTSPSGKAKIEIFGQGRNAFVGKLTLQPGAKVPVHRDASEEYLYVLSGSGKLVMAGTEHLLNPGDSVLMPAGIEVRFENGNRELVVLQVFAGIESAEKYHSWVEDVR